MSTPLPEVRMPVIDRLPVLPYWPVFSEWTGHMGDCPQCSFVMDRPEPQKNDLCPEGRVLQTALAWDLDQQHITARFN